MRLSHLAAATSFVVSLAAAAACGGATQSASPPAETADAAPSADATMQPTAADSSAAAPDTAPVFPYPAEHPPDPPQVITLGGPVLKSPKFVPVLFANDPDTAMQAKIADFVKKIGQTQFWKAIVTEYGVGPGTGVAPILLTAADNPPATLDDSVIQTWLAGKLNSNDPAWPAPDGNTIYALFYPEATTITLGGAAAGPDAGAPPADAGMTLGGGVETSCQYFGGYHQDITLDQNHGGMYVPYAVLPRCPAFNGLSAQDGLTSATSHELIEGSTDPYPLDDPAYIQVDNPHFYWSAYLGGGEVGDMCAQFLSSFTKFAELPDYEVQRSWSDKAAVAGQDPCVPPLPGEVYFNADPIMDSVLAGYDGQTVMASGVKIPQGGSKTIKLDLFSSAATSGAWSVTAADQATLRMQPAELGFTFDKTSGENGDSIEMTITVMTASKRDRESFLVQSTLGSQTNIWIGTVVN